MVTKKFNRTLPEHFACESSVNTCTEGLSSLIWCCVKCPVWCGVSATGPEDLRSDRTTTLGGGSDSSMCGSQTREADRRLRLSAVASFPHVARARPTENGSVSLTSHTRVYETRLRCASASPLDRLSCPARLLHGTRVSCSACIRMHVFVLERRLQAKYSCNRRRDSEQILNVSFVAAACRPSRQSS